MTLMMPIIDFHTLRALVPILFIGLSSTILLSDWKEIKFNSITTIAISALIFTPLGIYIGHFWDEKALKIILAISMIILSLYYLLNLSLPELKSDEFSIFFGILSGLFGGAFNVSDPPVVIYGTLRKWDPVAFRATLQGFFWILNLIIIFGHFKMGSYEETVVLEYCVWASAPMLLAAYFGKKLNAAIKDKDKFIKYVYILMLFLSFAMILNP